MFYNEATAVRLVVHGDEFTFGGTKTELDKMRRKMEEWYDIKERGGDGQRQQRDQMT